MKIGTTVTVNLEHTTMKVEAQIVNVILLFFTSGARCEGEGGVDVLALQGSQIIESCPFLNGYYAQ
jgi:hypothetical protein